MKLENIIFEKSKEYNFPLVKAKLYDQLSDIEKNNVDEIVQNNNFEYPEIIYNQNTCNQILITKNHLIKYDKDYYIKIELSDIIGLSIDENEKNLVRKNFDRMFYKFELTKWIIKTKNSFDLEIELEKGKTYYSFYHILQKLLRAKKMIS